MGILEIFARLRARLASRPDTEHEQAIVRVVLALVFFAYLFPEASTADGRFTPINAYFLAMLGAVSYSIAILAHILIRPGASPVRRLIGATCDIGSVTYFMSVSGVHGLPLFLIYIWVTLANGFRFGARYLVFCLGASVIGFSIVLFAEPFWQANLVGWGGLMFGMIALAMYVRSLVTRMFDALARAEAANVAKRRFISVVSHEMRTPLNAIIGMADLLRESPLNREQTDMLQTLRSSSRVLLGLVDDVLDFSKIEAGKLVLEKTDFDLHALVNTTCRILSAQASAKQVEFVVSIMPEVPPGVRGDPHYLRQVLINLAGNAVKFTEHGSVTVHVSSQGESESGVRLKFSVRDTGIGMTPEAQTKIFDSFSQADQSMTRRFGGTGLGTTIAKNLVNLMGGRIGVESATGLGSTFWFEIDLEKQPERTSAGEFSGARVLLVGFPAPECESLQSALSGWGAVPVPVPTIEQGAARLDAEISLAQPYHSAILYAAGDTSDLARRFRRLAPNPPPPAILAVPREADVQRFEALSSGFAAVLELPFEKRQIFNVLHSVSAGEEISEGVVRLQDYARRSGAAGKQRVLVADDNPTNREVIGKILERGGHAVTLVDDGDRALDAVERDQFDLVILDRNMPGMSGIEALRALRLMTRGRERLPVIMLSADVALDVKREAFETGADAFLAKPIEAMRLLEEIQSLCGDKDGKQQGRATGAQARAVTVASAQPSSPEVVNDETLQHLEELGSSPAFLEKLVTVFLSDSEGLLERMDKALGARNYGEFKSVLHAMKGSSASMGTDRLTRICARLGALSDGELRLQSPRLVRSLRDELSEARTALERHLERRRQSAG